MPTQTIVTTYTFDELNFQSQIQALFEGANRVYKTTNEGITVIEAQALLRSLGSVFLASGL